MSSKKSHDRKANLRFVQRAIRRHFDISLDMGDRDELFLGGTKLKVSGMVATNHYSECSP